MKQLTGRKLYPWGDPWGDRITGRRPRGRSKPVCPRCGGKLLAEPTAAARVIECVCIVCNSQLVLTRLSEGDVRVTEGTVDPRPLPATR